MIFYFRFFSDMIFAAAEKMRKTNFPVGKFAAATSELVSVFKGHMAGMRLIC
ncbi:Uncharacterized protein dnm_062470 [Desulfonema magnum]|uniref:Uncharacterized protein n=1 Tax=Desulfonema magnum TaxID=45655 RepID=A0A975BRA2_9BACT|nr:Uncharacterized protein dnm_062470 [Desulfonema magnum]